ncbi:MAG: DinB family protein [Candidatus Thorarchaeota archaeon]
MNREEAILFFENDHHKLETAISKLTEQQMIFEQVQGTWTAKEIIAHISAWNWEIITQANLVLSGKPPWHTYITEAEFNRIAVETRASWSLEKVITEWQESYNALVDRIRSLSENEWNFELDEMWPEGGKVSVSSIFGYRYRGEGHEGGHAIAIREYFSVD